VNRVADDAQTAGKQAGDQLTGDDYDVERERDEQRAPHAAPVSFTAHAAGFRIHRLLLPC
jgi:hypothetical protein